MALKREHLVDIDPETLTYVSGWPRIRRSIRRILLTRLRTRLMRLGWGSNFLDAQDKPINLETMMDSIIAASDAINDFEPEFHVNRVIISNADSSGSMQVRIEGIDLVDQQNRIIEESL